MKQSGWYVAALVLTCVMGLAKVEGQKPAGPTGDFPKPRFPASLGEPKSIADLMPYARAVARNKANILGLGLGVINPGETVLIVDTALSDDMCVEAVKRAMEERKVKVVLLHEWDLVGVSRADAIALRKAAVVGTTEDGYLEAAGWIGGIAGGEGPGWLKKRRPDLYEKVFRVRADQLPPNLLAARAKILGIDSKDSRVNASANPMIEAIKDYLTKHPEIRGVFYGKAGPIWMSFYPMGDKWLGTFMPDDRYGLINETSNYPADVWMLTEEMTMEPLGYTDKVHVTDPEGTDVSWDLTADQAQRWAKGVYLRGHLFMFPNEAYGAYALSVVDYPAIQKEWIDPNPIALLNGVVGSTASHNGFVPHMTEVWKDGYLREVRGGGLYGEVLREFLQYPNINTTKWPYYDKPGYFYHYETALGTNPKVVRDTTDVYGRILPERMREGVIHWALGAVVWNDPETPGRANKVYAWAQQNKLPQEHGYHLHTYFNTYQVHLRNTNKWMPLVSKGRMTSLDNPEVRALASRYGNADEVLADLWIPEIPGINAPGKYAEFAADPYKYSRQVINKVLSGKYEFFYNPAKAKSQN